MRNQLLSLFVALLATVGSLPMAAQEAYVVLSGGVLTFYYDSQRSTRQGTVYDIPAAKKKPDWVTNDFFASGNNIIKEAVFDDTFAAYSPTSTRSWCQTEIARPAQLQY